MASTPSVVAGAPGLRAAMLAVLVANVFLSAVWFKYFWLVFAVNRMAEGALHPPMSTPPREAAAGAPPWTARPPAAR